MSPASVSVYKDQSAHQELQVTFGVLTLVNAFLNALTETVLLLSNGMMLTVNVFVL